MMSRYAALLLLIWSVLPPADAKTLSEFSATYEILYTGIRAGETEISLLSQPGNGYLYRSLSTPSGLAKLFIKQITETSHFELQAGQLKPLRYEFDDGTRKGKRDSAVVFDWNTNTAVSRHNGEETEIAVTPGTVDRSALHIAVMLDLADGRTPGSYTIVEHNVSKTYEYLRLGNEAITTAAGTFDTECYESRREGSDRRSVICVAPRLGYLPVRVEQQKEDETQLVLTLREVDGLPETM